MINELLQDYSFFENSGGGVTFSGGEPLLYADYCYKLLKELKKHGVNTAIDTCGYVNKKAIDKVREIVGKKKDEIDELKHTIWRL